jgi:predicted transglutaminase-like cysteine proteinase
MWKKIKYLWKWLWASREQKKLWHLLKLTAEGNRVVDSQVNEILGYESNSDDEKVKKIKPWVIENISYMTDLQQFNESDHWQSPVSTLFNKRGDCEDNNMLLICLLTHAGILASRLRLAIGKVVDKDGKQGYHAYALYESSKGSWKILDTTFLVLDKDTYLFENNKYIKNAYYMNPDRILTAFNEL